MATLRRARASSPPALLLSLALVAGGGCALPAPDDDAGDGPLGVAASAQTVGESLPGCDSHQVDGLSSQIFYVGNCLVPGAFVAVPDMGNVSWEPGVFHLMEEPAKDALVACMGANGGMGLHINSMLRSVAEQYLLATYKAEHRCGIMAAAAPGLSNHESGLAMDIQNHAGWNPALSAYGFKWYGPADVVHFDYRGAGSVDYRGVDVLAFQHLWNANNPGDPIAEDGQYGPSTEARLVASPADGFPALPPCGCDCTAGQTQTEACTDCGSHTRGCDGCSWTDWGACVGPAEVCDGVDNDCNGLVDDGHPQTVGATPPDYASALVDLSAPQALGVGERASIWVDFRNVGAKEWPQGGLWLSARGGASGGPSALAPPESWPAWNVAAALDQTVPPGAIGRFTFDVVGPDQAGADLAETFQLQVPGGAFLVCPTPDISPTIHIRGGGDGAAGAGGASPGTADLQEAGGCSVRAPGGGWAGGAALSLALAALTRARRRRLGAPKKIS